MQPLPLNRAVVIDRHSLRLAVKRDSETMAAAPRRKGQGFKMSDADTARGNPIRHAEAAKAKDEVCLGNLTDGRYERIGSITC